MDFHGKYKLFPGIKTTQTSIGSKYFLEVNFHLK